MIEGTPEYVWPCVTVVIFAGLLLIPMLWFHPADVSPKGDYRPGSAVWQALAVFLTGCLLLLGSVVTAIWFIPGIGLRFWELLLGSVCVGPPLILMTVVGWMLLWPPWRGTLRRHAPPAKERQLTMTQLLMGTVILALFMAVVRMAYELPKESRIIVAGMSFLLAMYALFGVFVVRVSDDRLFAKSWRDDRPDAEEDDPPREP